MTGAFLTPRVFFGNVSQKKFTVLLCPNNSTPCVSPIGASTTGKILRSLLFGCGYYLGKKRTRVEKGEFADLGEKYCTVPGMLIFL